MARDSLYLENHSGEWNGGATMKAILGNVLAFMFCIGCAHRGAATNPQEAIAPRAALARIINRGSARLATVPEAVAFLRAVVVERTSGRVASEHRTDQADGSGNYTFSLVQTFEDGSVMRKEQTLDATGQLVRVCVYDDDAEGIRSGIRIEGPVRAQPDEEWLADVVSQ